MKTATAPSQSVSQLNSLLRGELSAIETYQNAILKTRKEHTSEATQLRGISQIHRRHADALRGAIRNQGGEPEETSGLWGTYAKTIEGVASLFGDAAAIKALKEGEEHGLKDYQEAIEDVDLESRRLIVDQFIPDQQSHIATLDRLMQAVK